MFFLLHEKLLLSQNKCADAFWLGNLKNRDLTGQEIQQDSDETEGEEEATDASPVRPSPRQSQAGFSVEADNDEANEEEDAIASSLEESDECVGETDEDNGDDDDGDN